jgi:hypothetical protein
MEGILPGGSDVTRGYIYDLDGYEEVAPGHSSG